MSTNIIMSALLSDIASHKGHCVCMDRANTKSVSGGGRFNYRKKGREGEPDPERQSKGGPGIFNAS